MDPVILASARKHGVSDQDMLHAHRNPIRVFDLGDLIMLIGGDEAGHLLELGVVIVDDLELLVHAMPARPRFLTGP